jgi:hypothetical protein
MSKRKRNYKKEYARRVALASQKGLSRSAARGHPRGGERRQKATEPSFDPNSREERALKMMRRGGSLRAVASHFRMSQERLRAYLKESTAATREKGRWKIIDHRPRQLSYAEKSVTA